MSRTLRYSSNPTKSFQLLNYRTKSTGCICLQVTRFVMLHRLCPAIIRPACTMCKQLFYLHPTNALFHTSTRKRRPVVVDNMFVTADYIPRMTIEWISKEEQDINSNHRWFPSQSENVVHHRKGRQSIAGFKCLASLPMYSSSDVAEARELRSSS